MFVQLIRHNFVNNRKLATDWKRVSTDLIGLIQEVSEISLINITYCLKTTDSKYFSYSKPLHNLLQNKQDVCDPFVTCECIIWNTTVKESQGIVFFFLIDDANSILKGSE